MVLAAACALVLGYRLFLCWQSPIETSDLVRNLGYSSHLAALGPDIYGTTAARFRPEAWTEFWSEQGYLYPPVALVFFAGFSSLGLGIFWVKLTLTLLDVAVAWLIGRHTSAWIGLLVLGAPMAAWYTSHEGQFESLVAFFLAVAVASQMSQRWLMSGLAFVLAIQTKQLAVFLAPWLLWELWKAQRSADNGPRFGAPILRFGAGLVLGLLPFASFYIRHPEIPFLPLQNQDLSYNPFAWNPTNPGHFGWHPTWLTYWDVVGTTLLLAIGVVALVRSLPDRTWHRALPLTLFVGAIKSLSWAQFWYTALTPALVFPLRQRRMLTALALVIYFLHDGRSLTLLAGMRYGPSEREQTVRMFERCRLTCHVQEER